MANPFNTMLDWMVMHQVRLMQLSILYLAQAQKELDESEEEVHQATEALAAYFIAVGGLRLDDLTGRGQIDNALQRILAARRRGFQRAMSLVSQAMQEVQQYERLFYTAALRASGKAVNLTPNISFGGLVMGSDLSQWQERLLANDVQRLRESLSLGVRLGENGAALRARLLGHSTYGGRDGVTAAARRELETLVRTVTSTFADLARVQINLENPLVGREVYIAVLDSRTTQTCRGYHGQVFAHDAGPRPPLHWYCRSTRVPLVGDGTPSIPSYREWLRRLSARDQNEVLGPRQAAQFREGVLEVGSFREPAWRGIDLRTMAERERQVFEAAGMDVPFQ